MALLECVIEYDERTKIAKTTYKVVKVGKEDQITFKSTDASTGIQYVDASPFKGSAGPQAGEVFHVGKKAGPFKVAVPSNGEPRHFACGEMTADKRKGVGSYETTGQTFTPWKGGGDTP